MLGVRDGIKRVWAAITQSNQVSTDIFEAVLSAVVGEDCEDEHDNEFVAISGNQSAANVEDCSDQDDNGEDDDKEVEDDNDDDDDNDYDDDNDDDNDDDANKGSKRDSVHTATRKTVTLTVSSDDDDDDSDYEGLDDDEIEAKAISRIQLLNSSGRGVEHHAEADGALLQMIHMRQMSRKSGIMLAKQKQLLIQTRAVDILEVLINRTDNANYLVPLFRPLFSCLKKIQASSMLQNTPEGKAFEMRLRVLIDTKLCKKRILICPRPESVTKDDELQSNLRKRNCEQKNKSTIDECDDDDEENDVDLVEETGAALSACISHLRSPYAPLRTVSHSAVFALLRVALSPEFSVKTKEILSTQLSESLNEIVSKKNTRLSIKLIEDMLQRFPEFTIASLFSNMLQATTRAVTPFLRSEMFRLVGGTLKRFRTLSSVAQYVLTASVPVLVDQIISSLSQDSLNTVSGAVAGGETLTHKTKDNRVKRLRPIINCTRDLVHMLKSYASSIRSTPAEVERNVQADDMQIQRSLIEYSPPNECVQLLTSALKSAISSDQHQSIKQAIEQILTILGDEKRLTKSDDTYENTSDKSTLIIGEKRKSVRTKSVVTSVEKNNDEFKKQKIHRVK